MALGETLVPDPANPGQCCTCAKQVACGCGTGPCSMKCRSFAATAEFCGFPTYLASNPPIYYRTKNLQGTLTTKCYTNPGCNLADYLCQQITSYGGYIKYDKGTCQLTQTGSFSSDGGCDGDPNAYASVDVTAGDFNHISIDGGVSFGFIDQYYLNEHTFSAGGVGTCIASSGGFVGCVEADPSAMSATLTDLDTVDDAIARATPKVTPWDESDNGNCAEHGSYATVNTPASPSSFAFQKAQVQVAVSGAVLHHNYQVTVQLGERAAGSVGNLSPYGSLTFNVQTADDGTAVSPWIDLPIEQGLNILAESCSVQDVT